ncbi:hypothetical protein LIPSTDRAFT_201350 [Lipomyces starkeyi NRRL Y-11557]|uniref:Uncharacterized protein n=1 Tax=Lipomyces starkeyi NRRL Y-11557 TaxID=675824 RepID=A0A1E3PUQ3_LIPST|nr:hypothetical protein LIPSTDRAFT_201350 [Lipomyces starkeyi NRRL Y-11557]
MSKIVRTWKIFRLEKNLCVFIRSRRIYGGYSQIWRISPFDTAIVGIDNSSGFHVAPRFVSIYCERIDLLTSHG